MNSSVWSEERIWATDEKVPTDELSLCDIYWSEELYPLSFLKLQLCNRSYHVHFIDLDSGSLLKIFKQENCPFGAVLLEDPSGI